MRYCTPRRGSRTCPWETQAATSAAVDKLSSASAHRHSTYLSNSCGRRSARMASTSALDHHGVGPSMWLVRQCGASTAASHRLRAGLDGSPADVMTMSLDPGTLG